MKEASRRKDAESNIHTVIIAKLLESVCSSHNLRYITAIKSATVTLMDKYSFRPVSKTKNKAEKGKGWYEVSISGGGMKSSWQVGFAEQSYSVLLFSSWVLTCHWKSYLMVISLLLKYLWSALSRVLTFISKQDHRETGQSSSYEWACVSKKYYSKDFFTINPLKIVNGKPVIMLISKFWDISHAKRLLKRWIT